MNLRVVPLLPPQPVTRPATEEDARATAALWSDYLRELSRFSPDVHADDPFDETWLKRPAELHPYLVLTGDGPVGFALVMGAEYARAVGHEVDFFLHDYFVAPRARGTGVAAAAFEELLARHPGEWGLAVLPRNARALAFWRRVLDMPPTEQREDEHVFRFRSSVEE